MRRSRPIRRSWKKCSKVALDHGSRVNENSADAGVATEEKEYVRQWEENRLKKEAVAKRDEEARKSLAMKTKANLEGQLREAEAARVQEREAKEAEKRAIVSEIDGSWSSTPSDVQHLRSWPTL